jgi:hypothetical protein
MVEAAPPAPFVIAKAKLLLELLIIALDPPPQLCQIDQTIERGIFGQGGKPILRRLGFVFRPLDQKPLFSAQLAPQIIAMRRPHSSPGKARGEPIRGSLAPSDRLPPWSISDRVEGCGAACSGVSSITHVRTGDTKR